MSRRLRRIAAGAAAAALVLGAAPAPAPAAPWPTTPTDPAVAAQWVGADSRVGADGPLELAVESVAPHTVTAAGALRLSLRLTNRGEEPLDEVSLRLQRADPLDSAEDAATALAEPESAFPVATDFREPLRLDPGQGRTVTLRVEPGRAAPEGLGVTAPGVYPVLVNANGRRGGGIVELLAETRTLVPIDAEGGDAAAGAGEPAPPAPPGLTLLWPLATRVPLTPGEVGEAPDPAELMLADGSLAAAMDRGRLGQLLGALEEALAAPGGERLRQATCLAVDPELVETASRMADGYLVGSRRPDPVGAGERLRDSWGRGDDGDAEPAGDAEAAARWLTRLRALAADLCVVAWPWASAEAAAVAGAGDPALAGTWLDDGPETISRVLGAEPLPGVVLPPEGYLTGAAADLLSARAGAGELTALVASGTVTSGGAPLPPGAATYLRPGLRAVAAAGEINVALAGTGARPGLAGWSRPLGRHRLEADSAAARMQSAIGVLHQRLREGDAPALITAPPPEWSVDGAGAREWLTAAGEALAAGEAAPLPLERALGPRAGIAAGGTGAIAAPPADPGAVTDAEIGRAGQQARYLGELTSLMAKAPDIALTPAGFTRPLRRDVLRSLTTVGRRWRPGHDRAVAAAARLQAEDGRLVRRLRDSVRILAPGGVYTRATDASPVAVVASNGLPLPVPARVLLDGQGMAQPLREQAMLPAKGSVTLQLFPDVDPGDRRRSELTMVLEDRSGRTISAPVDITVRSGPRVRSLVLLGLLAAAALGTGTVLARRRADRFRPRRAGDGQWGP